MISTIYYHWPISSQHVLHIYNYLQSNGRIEDLAFDDRFQGVNDEQMDASYVNNITNFDQGDF